MPAPDYHALFVRYADALNRSLSGSDEIGTIRSFYAETSLALGQDGSMKAASNEELGAILAHVHEFYVRVRVQSIAVERAEVSELAPRHHRVLVHFVARYLLKGSEVAIPFWVTYLCQEREDGPKIFAFIAGDEMALLRQHGIIDDSGEPVEA